MNIIYNILYIYIFLYTFILPLYFTFIFTLVRSISITVLFILAVVICAVTRAIIVPEVDKQKRQKCFSLRTSPGTGVSITSTTMSNKLNPTNPVAFFITCFCMTHLI